ncbi:UNVERIFIED_CONTAM: hypothetical protein GTU68_045535 [Idotea baltica]|nr:hypothetical protein [Idotea baltica]
MKITNYGHGCFGVETAGKHLLFDPFITPNEKASHIDVDQVPADYILITHAHFDHITDVVRIAQNTGAKLISNYEIIMHFKEKGLEKGHPMNYGGSWTFGDIRVKQVKAVHSSSFADGTYGGNPSGFIVYSPEGNFYFSGDTALHYDMKLLGEFEHLSFAFLCIGDNFTMGISDAVIAADFIQCNTIIGMHYDTFGYIMIDHDKARESFATKGKKLILSEIGTPFEV